MNYWNMQLHPDDLNWNREKELLKTHHLIGLGDWDELSGQQNAFETEMEKGDYVLIKRGGEIIALTKVVGDYQYESQTDDLLWFERRREVEIIDWYKSEYAYTVTPRKTLERYKSEDTQMYKDMDNWVKKSLYRKLLETYKQHRKIVAFDTENAYEIYKWQLITHANGKSPLQIVKEHVANPNDPPQGGFWNLIAAQFDNVALKYLIENKADLYSDCLDGLIDENIPLDERLLIFKNSVADLFVGTSYGSKANDERTAATILTCYNPQKYTFYKDNKFYEEFCKYLLVDRQKPGKKYSHYLQLLQPLVDMIKQDNELKDIIKQSCIANLLQSDLLIAQDICWELFVAFPKKLNPKTMTDTNIQHYIAILRANRNLILTGAPGTGKTYLAKQIAEEMGAETGFVQFHPSYDYTDFVEGLRPTQDDNGNVGFERTDGVFKAFCAKAYENYLDSQKSLQTLQQEVSVRDKIYDFVQKSIDEYTEFKTQGTKNTFHIIASKAKSITIEIPNNEKTRIISLPKADFVTLLENNVNIVDGKDIQAYFQRKYRTQQDSYTYVLYNLLRKNKTEVKQVSLIKKKDFVFIIDEINRGEVSKIFGELFFSIDPGYRGKEKGTVSTQYQNLVEDGDVFKKGFFVPENVYIIGTMNDIDRSVESMDFAFRRRFAFVEIKADDNVAMLDNLQWKDDAIARMKRLNAQISQTEGLGAAYHIGASYFLKLNNYDGDFQQLWDYHLEGLLREYLRGFQDVDNTIKKLKAAYDNVADTDNGQQPQL